MFDLQIVDEAFQLPDYRFHMIAGLAKRIILVGDPGQIHPVITCDVDRWRSDPAGPHVPCPKALLARHPRVPRLSLPVSRRLGPDTVSIVQPAFYPDLSFTALAQSGDRQLITGIKGVTVIDRVIDAVSASADIAMLQLPARITGELDEELSDIIVRLIKRLFERQTLIVDEGQSKLLKPAMVGVVCAHVSQVHVVQERLPSGLSDILVETSDRFQGLERSVILVYHPLSGRSDGSSFHMDAGRVCVMLSRHRNACILVARCGIEEMLFRYAPQGNRALGVAEDEEFTGWYAHHTLLEQLEQRGRVIKMKSSELELP
jgi:superfamily I DNA and/or RNA helicase